LQLKIGRNEPCPCGSGRKYKLCCLSVHERERGSAAAATAWPASAGRWPAGG